MSKRLCLCGGDFCAFNLGFLASPFSACHEIGCCNCGVGASGFGWHSTAREVADKLGKRLDGQMAIVTGANNGVGLETAKVLYELGATVILACRNAKRAEAAKLTIESEAETKQGAALGSLLIIPFDASSLKSVESFAAQVNTLPQPLTLLVCNAGIMGTPFSLTEDGLESQYQVNYLSHHYLTLLLADKLKAASPVPARVINISSISHAWVPFPGGCCGPCCSVLCCYGGFDLSGKRFPAQSDGCCAYEPFEDYAYSKACQVISAAELQRRVFKDTNVVAVSVAPGMSVESKITEGSSCLRCLGNYTPMFSIFGAIVGKSLPRMASTVVYAGLVDNAAGGDHFRNTNKSQPYGPARDPMGLHGAQLWELSNKVCFFAFFV